MRLVLFFVFVALMPYYCFGQSSPLEVNLERVGGTARELKKSNDALRKRYSKQGSQWKLFNFTCFQVVDENSAIIEGYGDFKYWFKGSTEGWSIQKRCQVPFWQFRQTSSGALGGEWLIPVRVA